MTKELIKKNESNEYVEGSGQEKAFSHGKSWVSEKRYCDTNNETTGRYSGNNGFSTRKKRWYSSRKHQTGPSNLVYKDVQASHFHHHPPCFPFILCILAFTSSLKFEALSSFSFLFPSHCVVALLALSQGKISLLIRILYILLLVFDPYATRFYFNDLDTLYVCL